MLPCAALLTLSQGEGEEAPAGEDAVKDEFSGAVKRQNGNLAPTTNVNLNLHSSEGLRQRFRLLTRLVTFQSGAQGPLVGHQRVLGGPQQIEGKMRKNSNQIIIF